MLSVGLTLMDMQTGDASGAQDDARLLAAAKRQDRQAFSLLLSRHYEVVYRVVWRLMRGHGDSEDVTQEAFLRLWKNPGQLRDAGALRGWLIRVASNLAMDRFRYNKEDALEAADDVMDDRADGARALEQKQIAARMDRAIAALPERQKLAITLVQFENLSNQAAADVMEISLDALESLLARAKRTLKQDLAGEWQQMLSAFSH